jgi:hypothetical protein
LERVDVANLTTADLQAGRTPPGLDGLVYDLAPWDERAMAVLEAVAALDPPPPLLMYPPTRLPSVGPLLVRAGAMIDAATAQFQGREAHGLEPLRRQLRALFQQVPRLQLRAVVRRCLDTPPPVIADYTEAVIGLLFQQDTAVDISVRGAARRLRTTTRHIERSCKAATLPTPKEILDWILLIHVAYLARRRHVAIWRVARRVGINTNRLYRIRRRLLRNGGTRSVDSPKAGFQDIVQAFTERCRVAHFPL